MMKYIILPTTQLVNVYLIIVFTQSLLTIGKFLSVHAKDAYNLFSNFNNKKYNTFSKYLKSYRLCIYNRIDRLKKHY